MKNIVNYKYSKREDNKFKQKYRFEKEGYRMFRYQIYKENPDIIKKNSKKKLVENRCR